MAQKPETQPADFHNIGSPARSALALVGYTRLDQLTTVSAAEILKLHGVGPKAIRLLREAMAERGIKFRGD